MEQAMRTCLYKAFDKENRLLYVGISLNWKNRLQQHAKDSLWFVDVADIKIEWFDTRDQALSAEADAIKREKPEYNVAHNLSDHSLLSCKQDEESVMKMQIKHLIIKSGKVFFTQKEICDFLNVPSTDRYIDVLQSYGLKPVKPFSHLSKRTLYYVDDVVDCVMKISQSKGQVQ
jgi:predicted GIY-YIG superfamily endonuclease